jgi:hypothetical protein
MVRTGQEQGKIGRRHDSTLAGNALYKGDTKWRCVILMLVSIRNGRRIRFHDKRRRARFHDKRRRARFRDGRWNGRRIYFLIKGDAPLATCVSLTCIIRDAQ